MVAESGWGGFVWFLLVVVVCVVGFCAWEVAVSGRVVPVAVVLRGGPLDGQTEQLWPSGMTPEIALLWWDPAQVGPGCWFTVWRRSGPVEYTFVGWEWYLGVAHGPP